MPVIWHNVSFLKPSLPTISFFLYAINTHFQTSQIPGSTFPSNQTINYSYWRNTLIYSSLPTWPAQLMSQFCWVRFTLFKNEWKSSSNVLLIICSEYIVWVYFSSSLLNILKQLKLKAPCFKTVLLFWTLVNSKLKYNCIPFRIEPVLRERECFLFSASVNKVHINLLQLNRIRCVRVERLQALDWSVAIALGHFLSRQTTLIYNSKCRAFLRCNLRRKDLLLGFL